MSSRVRLVAISNTYGIVKGPNVKRCFMSEWVAKWGKLVIPAYPGMVELLQKEPLWRRLIWMASKTGGAWKITAYREPRHTKYKKSRYLMKAKELGIEGRKCRPRKMKPPHKRYEFGLPVDDEYIYNVVLGNRVFPNAPNPQPGNPYGQMQQQQMQNIQEFVDRQRQRQRPGAIQFVGPQVNGD